MVSARSCLKGCVIQCNTSLARAVGTKFSLVWITKAFNLEWLLNLWERGKPQNKPSKKRAVAQLENANFKDTRRSRQIQSVDVRQSRRILKHCYKSGTCCGDKVRCTFQNWTAHRYCMYMAWPGYEWATRCEQNNEWVTRCEQNNEWVTGCEQNNEWGTRCEQNNKWIARLNETMNDH